MNVITAEDLFEIKTSPNVVILDVREDIEVKENPFQGVSVLHIPMNDLIHRLHELDECKHIIVVCVVGGRSAKVCEFLETKGYEHISNLTGGILAWQSLNY